MNSVTVMKVLLGVPDRNRKVLYIMTAFEIEFGNYFGNGLLTDLTIDSTKHLFCLHAKGAYILQLDPRILIDNKT